jgi:uncharacterized membrane protein YjgN (DUF898 family)
MSEIKWNKLLKFNGNHGEYVSLRIINNILTALTIGFYYPWARVANFKYLYGETEFMETRFVFHGTGKEIFKGYLKAIGIITLLYVILIYCISTHSQPLTLIGLSIYFIGIMLLIPIAIHGSNRYRLSRTSWRGIHFGYRGNLKEFYKLYFVQTLLAIITLGIYNSWMHVNVSKYIREHIRFGNIELKYEGKGVDLFIIKLKGLFFIILTLGIYSFWYYKNLIEFEIKNTKFIQNGKEIQMRSTLTAGNILFMIFTNYLIILLTLGIGTGIAINRILRKAFENLEFSDEIDSDSIVQTEEDYKDATGDDLASFLDISII